MNIVTSGALALVLSVPQLLFASPKPAARDSYALVRGHFVRMDGSIEELEALRDAYGANILWVRRSGSRYVLRDPRIIDEAAACFDRLGQLEPERIALQRKQEALDREEESLDRRQERLENARESRENEDEQASSPDPKAEAEQRDIAGRQEDVSKRQRELETVERDLDRREDALEKEAEGALWKLIDGAIRAGAAAPLPR
jgi:DNA repair exonuclease SbcCD ATPase subunit